MANPLDETLNFTPKFDADGLIPAVAIERSTGQPLMLAFMNKEAITETLKTGYAHFWSRSRQKLWQKGETSNNRLKVAEVLIDCDQDSISLMVDLEGVGSACHTGRKSCYYRRLKLDPTKDDHIQLDMTDDSPLFDPNEVYGRKA